MAESVPVATQWYRAAIDKDPNYWPARLSLSRLLLQEDQTERALKLLERSRSEGVKDIRLSAYLADAYRQSKLFDKAIDEIGVVIEKFPKTPEYIFIRGNIYFDRGSYDNAMGDFNKAYELNPSYHEAYFFVGRTWFQKGDSATALKMFRHVLDYQPNNGKFRYYMGVALESEDRLQQALEEYRKVTEVDPGYGVRNPQVYISRGRLLSRLGYSRDGKQDLVKALELAPENVEALVAMGEADFRDQDYEAAIKNFTKALSKTPKRPAAQYQLGMAHIFQKNNRDGARHLQLAVKYGYADPEVYQTLGYLYKDLGRRPEARTAFKTFLKETEGKGIKIPQNTRKEVLGQIKELGG
jgi:tetratricopeptide (TPR) repeat protein